MMKLNNHYYIMRHGEALSNTNDVMSSWPETFNNHLTDHGKEMVQTSAESLQGKGIDMIFASDVQRAAETARIVEKVLQVPLHFDERLREIGFGEMNGKSVSEIRGIMGRYEGGGYGQFGGEDYKDVSERMGAFLKDLEKKYKDKEILVISHQAPLTLFEERVRNIPLLEITKIPEYVQIQRAEVRELTANSAYSVPASVK